MLGIVVGTLFLNLLSADASEQQLLSNLELPRSATTSRLNLQIGQGFVTGRDPVVLGSVGILSGGFSNMHFGIYASRTASTHWLDRSNSPGPIFSFSDPVLIGGPGFTPQTFDAPGTLITPLSGPLTAASGQIAAYVPETVIALQPNTRYFVAITRKTSSSSEVSAFHVTAGVASSDSTGFSFDPYYTLKNPTTMQLIVGGWNPTGESTATGNIQLELNKARVTTHRGVFFGGLIPAGELVAIEAGATVSGDIVNNGILRFPSSSSTQVATSISGAGVVVVDGGGAVTLTGQNTYSGMTTISNGTLRIGSGGTSGSITSPITNNGSLVFDRSDNLVYSGRITGTGAVTKSGSGTLALTGQNDLRGGTVISEGVLALQSWGALGTTGDILMTGGTLQFSASNREDYSRRFKPTAGQNFSIDTNGQSVSFASTIAGANNGLKKYGEGTLTLAAANTYSGSTTLYAGTLIAGDSRALGTGPVIVEGGILDVTSRSVSNQIINDSKVVFGGPTLSTYASVISGTGEIIKRGGGVLRLISRSTLTGPTRIEEGSIQLAHVSALSASTISPLVGGTLSVATSLRANIGGLDPKAGGLVDVGTGLITVAGGLSKPDLTAALMAGRGDGSWTGSSGIVSSAVLQNRSRTVGWLEQNNGSLTFGYAAPGDTNLDWTVDVFDVSALVSGGKYNSREPAVWAEGDFNYDGVFDIWDLSALASTNAYNSGPYNSAPTGTIAAVPEPRLLGIGAASVGLLTFLWRKMT